MGVAPGRVAGAPIEVPNVTKRRERAGFGELCTWAVDFWPSRGRERRFVTLCTLDRPRATLASLSRRGSEPEPAEAVNLRWLRDLLGDPGDDHAPSRPDVLVDPVDLKRRLGRAEQGVELGTARGVGDDRREPLPSTRYDTGTPAVWGSHASGATSEASAARAARAEHEQRAAGATGELLRGAPMNHPAERPIAARADDQQVDGGGLPRRPETEWRWIDRPADAH
jgi:hypothetical protein